MEQKSNQDRGQFNLDYEETVILKSKNYRLISVLDSILGLIDRVLNSPRSNISASDRDLLKEAKTLARKAKE